MTRWSPDTCGCIVEYDDDLTVQAVVTKCAKHATTANDDDHLAVVMAHNRKKNAVHAALIDHLKSIGLPHEEAAVAYDANDNLHITAAGLSLADKESFKTIVARHVGATAVVIAG